jgi:hypothetical protein
MSLMRPTAEDRRQHRRYELENSISVSSDGIFQITDISRGGFCFKCPPSTSISDFLETDILTPVEQLKSFPAKRVWVSMAENGSHEFLPMVVGAKFRRLTQKQEAVLSQIIQAISTKDGPEQ